MELKHSLFFNDKKYEFTVEYKRAIQLLSQIPQEIGAKLINNKDYTVESQVQLEVFQSFLDYWKDSKEPEINSDNLFDYYLLSKEFGLMKDFLAQNTNENEFHLSSLKHISNIDNSNILLDKSEDEKYIALHLDSYLSENEEQMLKIPINSLYNIFFHEERVLADQQKAFDFITKNKNTYPDLLTLLPSLDSQNLKHDDIISSITKSQENIGFMPKVSPSIFDSYEIQINQLREKNKAYKHFISKLICPLFEDRKRDDSEEKLIASILHENFYDVNEKFSYKNENVVFEVTPLHVAILLKNIDLVKILLEKPEIDVNAKSYVGYGKSQYDESLELFKDEEEKLKVEHFKNEEETTPLYCAIKNGNIEIVKLLLDCPQIDVNEKVILESNTYYVVSAEISSSGLKLAESIVQSPETILKSEENLKKALKSGDNRKEMNAFHLAIEEKNTEIVKLLLSHPKLDINIKFISMETFIEAKLGSKKLFTLYERYVEMNAFHYAFENESKEIANLLLTRSELDINSKFIKIESFGTASLLSIGILQSQVTHSPLLSSLSDTKIPLDRQDVEIVDKKTEKSSLYFAVECQDIEVVKLLLSRKDLDINSKSFEESYYKLALSESELLIIQEKAPEIFEMINVAKEDLTQTKKEETTLHLAVKKSNTEIIKALLENRSIDTNITDEQEKKPIDLTNDNEIKALLEKPRH